LEGAAVRLVDTAGFRESGDMVEVEGIKLAVELLEQCHLILVLNDSTEGKDHSTALLKSLRAKFPDAECQLVHTKLDILGTNTLDTSTALAISTVSGSGMTELKRFLASKAQVAPETVSDALINARQASLLRQAADSLQKAREAALAGESNEFTAIDLRDALKRIGEITGAVWNDDILNTVFGKFCIGK